MKPPTFDVLQALLFQGPKLPRHPCRSPKGYSPGPTLEISGQWQYSLDSIHRYLQTNLILIKDAKKTSHRSSTSLSPICSMVLVYSANICPCPKSPSHVGKYTSTMVRIWVQAKQRCEYLRFWAIYPSSCHEKFHAPSHGSKKSKPP